VHCCLFPYFPGKLGDRKHSEVVVHKPEVTKKTVHALAPAAELMPAEQEGHAVAPIPEEY